MRKRAARRVGRRTAASRRALRRRRRKRCTRSDSEHTLDRPAAHHEKETEVRARRTAGPALGTRAHVLAATLASHPFTHRGGSRALRRPNGVVNMSAPGDASHCKGVAGCQSRNDVDVSQRPGLERREERHSTLNALRCARSSPRTQGARVDRQTHNAPAPASAAFIS